MPARSRRPWWVLLLLAGCADYTRPERPCDRVGLLCLQDAGYDLGVTRSRGASGDLDGDDRRDLVSAGDQGLSITWGLSQTREYRLIPGGVAGAKLGDVDADGDLDVVFVTREPATLRVLENRGARALVDGPNLPLPGRAGSLWLGRLDADDSLDAIVGGGDDGRLSVITAGLTRITSIAVGQDLAAVEAGDLDGDGRLDIVAADRGAAAVHVVLAQGDGFAAPRRLVLPVAPEYLQLYDLDGDEQLDILTHGDRREIWWQQNQGAGEFVGPRGLIVQDEPSPGFGAHRDAQGRRWLLTIARSRLIASELDDADQVVRRVLGDTSQATGLDMDDGSPLIHGAWFGQRHALESGYVFTELWRGGHASLRPHALADLDQDGALDLVTGGSRISVHRGLADGTWDAPATVKVPREIVALTVADVTGDALLDLVISDDAPSVYVALGAGDGTFVAGPATPLDATPVLLYGGLAAPGEAAAVAVGGFNTPGVAVLRFDAAGALSGRTEVLATGTARTLAGADLDDDGAEDLVALMSGDDAGPSLVIVPRVDAGWGPARPRSLADLHTESAPDLPLSSPILALGDIDLDDRTDAVLLADDAIVRLLDIGADAPPPARLDELELRGPQAVVLADIDGDGPLDIVACASDLEIVLVGPDDQLRPQVPVGIGVAACALHVDADDRRASAAIETSSGTSVLRPDLAPTLARTASFQGGPDVLENVVAGDVDADGHTDLVASGVASGVMGDTTVLWGHADGRPRRAAWHASHHLFERAQIAVAPLDDRPGDELLTAWSGGQLDISTHGDGTLRQLWTTTYPGYDAAVGVQRRPDGRSDVVVLSTNFVNEIRLSALPRGEDGSPIEGAAVELWTLPSGLRGSSLAVADFDGDDYDDVAVLPGPGLAGDQIVIVVWGDHDRSGADTTVMSDLPQLRDITGSDLDGDGTPELVLGSLHGASVFNFIDRAPRLTGAPLERTTAVLLLADLEGDGHADILQVNGTDLDIVLRSSGADAPIHLDLAAPWTQLRAVDLDGDEILDLVGLQDGSLVTRLTAGQ